MNGRDAFLDALVAAALEPTTPIDFPDGNLARYRVRGDKPGSRNGWAVYHAQPLPAGAFGSWRTGESHTWRDAVAMSRLTPVQRQQAAVSQRDRERLRAEAEVSVRALARNRAARLWAPARPATDMHPYLQAKRVPAYGIRQLRDMLVIPARDAAGELHTLQFISADGAKRFLSGGRISGCYYAIAGSGDGADLRGVRHGRDDPASDRGGGGRRLQCWQPGARRAGAPRQVPAPSPGNRGRQRSGDAGQSWPPGGHTGGAGCRWTRCRAKLPGGG